MRKKTSDTEKIKIIVEYILLVGPYNTIRQRTVYKDYPIGVWIMFFRSLYNNGNLDSKVELALRNLGEKFRKSDKERLNYSEKIAIIKECIGQGYQYANIKSTDKYQNYPVGEWVATWRSLYYRGKLNKKIEQELRNLGERFERRNHEQLDSNAKISIIKEYLGLGNQYSDIKVRDKYQEYPIGVWINDWRMSYNRNMLSIEVEQELRNLGEAFERKVSEYLTDLEKFKIIKEYMSLGNSYDSITRLTRYNEYKIGVWITVWRNQYRNGKLDIKIEQKLRNLGETFEYKRVRNLKINENAITQDLKLTDEIVTDPRDKTKHL